MKQRVQRQNPLPEKAHHILHFQINSQDLVYLMLDCPTYIYGSHNHQHGKLGKLTAVVIETYTGGTG